MTSPLTGSRGRLSSLGLDRRRVLGGGERLRDEERESSEELDELHVAW